MTTPWVLRRVGIAWLLCAVVCHGTLFGAEAERPDFAPLFYLPFDGSAAAVSKTATTVTGDADLRFAEGNVGQAADFREHGCLEYRGLPPINAESGAIEMWIKPDHDAKELQDHYYLQFFAKDNAPLVEIKFYQVEMSVQATAWVGKSAFRRYGWGFNKHKWTHIVVTWETADPDLAGLRLYLDGRESGYPCPYSPVPMPQMLRVGCKSPEEGLVAKALMDEVCVYNRCLTARQVRTLCENGRLPMDKRLDVMRRQIAQDDQIARQRMDALFNHRKLGMIHGRNTSLVHWKDEAFKPLRIPVPDKIHETAVAQTDLKPYDALIVPGGGGLNLTDADKEALLRYVREGGGYVGICGGAVTARRCGLIASDQYAFGVRGSVWTTLKPHPITEGYDVARKVLFPHASGPLFVIKDPSEQAVILFDVGNPPLPAFAHTIVREYGKGRVAVFSGHPESSADTRTLFHNAVLWAAKVTGNEEG